MTLPLCASRCAPADAARTLNDQPTGAMLRRPGALRASITEIDEPWGNDWDEFDPAPLERWILTDFDWEVEEHEPQSGDYWDDSLDSEWDLARANDQRPMTHAKRSKRNQSLITHHSSPATRNP